ncbi:hypothetical protein KIN20_009424 [Parelaphostrongylus tenuis]|uniref:Uncharacterized protein n=1 Tax=Parelaphostrongylus tenuis TaxID=148309 RepID=A0AAD5M6C7_PARTN|nr:hypothetical protein KIN20_009424 [Parelaphostrongylus tenuis]
MIRFLLVLFLPTPSMHGYASTQNENKSPEKRKRSMLDDDPCLDAQQIFTSSGLRYQWTWAKSLAVRGLQNDTTIDDVLRYLDGHDCLFLAIGHAVWQSVQRARPVRIEGEISCSIPYAHSICVQRYGMEACSLYPNSGNDNQFRLEIGDGTYNRSKHLVYSEPLVLFEWGSTLLLPTLRWSYTVMTMAIYDNTIGQVYLVDMTGRGYADTCGKSLAAVVEDTMWSEWADEDIAKAYQFYLLRTMGFAVSNHELQAAQAFYCESILHGAVSLADENLTTTCHLIYPDHFARKQLAKPRRFCKKKWVSTGKNLWSRRLTRWKRFI